MQVKTGPAVVMTESYWATMNLISETFINELLDSHHATAHPAFWRCEVRFWWEQSGLGPSFHPQHLCCHPRPLSQAYTCQGTRGDSVCFNEQ